MAWTWRSTSTASRKTPYGGTRAGFTATTEIDRKDFGINTNLPLDGGGAVVGDKVQISLEIEAILQPCGARP